MGETMKKKYFGFMIACVMTLTSFVNVSAAKLADLPAEDSDFYGEPYNYYADHTMWDNFYNPEPWVLDESGRWWYQLGSGEWLKDDWYIDQGKWIYFDEDGWLVTGWLYVDNHWYFKNSDWYYMDSSGYMQTGWQKINNKWYYLGTTGEMQTGWQYIDNEWYYFDFSGEMQTGWILYNDKWYYMDSTGAMLQDEWTADGYYLNVQGVWEAGY